MVAERATAGLAVVCVLVVVERCGRVVRMLVGEARLS